MTDPRISQIISISQPDTTSEVAGSASVMPGYIRADVPESSQVAQTEAIDNAAVSAAPAGITGTAERTAAAGGINSGKDQLSMDTIYEIMGAMQYINPSDTTLTSLLWTLKDSGVINNFMSYDQAAMAIHNYVISNFTYQAEASADHWQSASETLALRGGDCEDLANLEAGLMLAAFVDRGMSIEDADKKVSVVVTLNTSTKIGHVYVQYTGNDGSIKYLDPSNSRVLTKIDPKMQVLFTYNAEGTDLMAADMDYSDLTTEGYTIALNYPDSLDAFVLLAKQQEGILQNLINEIMKCQMIANLSAANTDLSTAQTYYSQNGTTENYNALLQAQANQTSAIGLFSYAFGCPTSSYASVYNANIGNYINRDLSTGFWTVNWSGPILTTVKDQAENVKGMLAAITMLYEAARDMRNLVSEELSGETGYRGMRISQIFSRKVNKVMETLEKSITDMVDSANNVNEANAKSRIENINANYETNIIGPILLETPPMSSADTRERRALEKENDKLAEINTVNTQYKQVELNNLAGAKAILTGMQGAELGGNLGTMWHSLDTAVDGAINATTGLPSIEVVTPGQFDDTPAQSAYTGNSRYYEIDRYKLVPLRTAIEGAFSLRRIAMAAGKTTAEMRNLVHQEMTGISGRQSRVDVAEEMDESLHTQILNWFDNIVTFTESKVRLSNQLRANQLQQAQNKELRDTMRSQEGKINTAIALQWVSTGLVFASYFVAQITLFGILLSTIIKIVAVIIGAIAAAMMADAAKIIARKRYDLENSYRNKDIQTSPYSYTKRTINPITTGSSLTDNIMKMAVNSENDGETWVQKTTVMDDFIKNFDDNHVSGYPTGSSAFDTVAFAWTGEIMATRQIMMYLAESARKALINMRDFVHQEMTQIGGRSSSNLANSNMEAIKNRNAYIANQSYSAIMEIVQSRNTRAQRRRNVHMYWHYKDNAEDAAIWAMVPVIGGTIGNVLMNIRNMKAQRGAAEETARDRYGNEHNLTTSATVLEPELNVLFSGTFPTGMKGYISSGGGNIAVNYGAISEKRDLVAKGFIKQAVVGSINKAQMQMRSLTHQEMANLGSYEGSDIVDQVVGVKFQAAMKSVGLITQFLTQRVQIVNRVKEAKDKVTLLNSQINTAENYAYAALGAGIATIIFGYAMTDSISFAAVLGIVQLANTVASAIIAVGNMVNSWMAYNFAKKEALEEMGDLDAYTAAKKTMTETDVNASENRLETLEQQATDEITSNLFQSLAGGYIGVNRGLSAKYSAFIEGLYRGEKTRASLKEMLRELRSAVHETMTGISSAIRGVATTVLEMKMQVTLARVEDAFAMLEQAVERWNQIQDAKREKVKALIAAQYATFQAIIQVVMAIVSVIAFAAQLDAENAKTEVDTVKADAAKGLKTQQDVVNAEIKANNLKITSDNWQTKLGYLDLATKGADFGARYYFADAQRTKMRRLRTQGEERVKQRGVSTGARTSAVIGANQRGGGWKEFGASTVAAYGQQELDAKKASYYYRSVTQVDKEYKQQMNMLWNDIKKWAIEKGVEKLLKWLFKERDVVPYPNTQAGAAAAASTPTPESEAKAAAVVKGATGGKPVSMESVATVWKSAATVMGPDFVPGKKLDEAYAKLETNKNRMDIALGAPDMPTVPGGLTNEALTPAGALKGSWMDIDLNKIKSVIMLHLNKQLNAVKAELAKRMSEVSSTISGFAARKAGIDEEMKKVREKHLDFLTEIDELKEKRSKAVDGSPEAQVLDKRIVELGQKIEANLAAYYTLEANVGMQEGAIKSLNTQLDSLQDKRDNLLLQGLLVRNASTSGELLETVGKDVWTQLFGTLPPSASPRVMSEGPGRFVDTTSDLKKK